MCIQYNLDYPNPFGQHQKSLGLDKQKSSDNWIFLNFTIDHI